MELIVTRSNLLRALNTVNKAVSSKPTLDVLKNISLKAEGNTLKFASTNLEISITTFIGVDIVKEGETTVNSKTFTEFVNFLPEGNINIKLENSELIVETEKTKSKFTTIPYEEFPTLPTSGSESILLYKLDKLALKDVLNKTTFVADRGIRQPVFSGVLFEREGENLVLVATDSYRLSKTNLNIIAEVEKDFNPVVPYSSLDQLLRVADEEDEDYVEVFMVSKNNQVLFKVGRIEITTSLLDGEYPNYRAIMPERTVCTYELNLDELINAIKLSNVFARQEEASRITFTKKVDEGEMLFSSRMSEVGEYESSVAVVILQEEEEVQIDFNPKKLLEILGRINTEEVILELVVKPRSEFRMVIVKEKGNDKFLHLISPLIAA